jgi:hypothetical protein
VVDNATQVLVEVKGLVDTAGEIEKQLGLITKKEQYIEGLSKKLDSQKQMPEKVRADLTEKVEAAKAELVLLREAVSKLESLA